MNPPLVWTGPAAVVGKWIEVIEYLRAGTHLLGIDLTPRQAEPAYRQVTAMGLSAEIVSGDGNILNFLDTTFDRESSNNVLHFASRPGLDPLDAAS